MKFQWSMIGKGQCEISCYTGRMNKLEIFKLAVRKNTNSVHTVSTSAELIHYRDSLNLLAPRSYPVSVKLLNYKNVIHNVIYYSYIVHELGSYPCPEEQIPHKFLHSALETAVSYTMS